MEYKNDTESLQNFFNNKKTRKANAVKLPEELNESMIPKYVVYYKECYNKELQLFREFFKIEKHPKQIKNKLYISSKSSKISILEKLGQIKKIMNDIDTDIDIDLDTDINTNTDTIEIKDNFALPKYISLKKHINDDKKYYLIFDKKIRNIPRKTYKLVYTNEASLTQNLSDFIKKIKIKYDEDIL